MTLDPQTTATAALNFSRVQTLRNLRDETFLMKGCCKGAVSVLKTLDELFAATVENDWSIEPFMKRLEGHLESLSIFTSRVSNSIELVSKTDSLWDLVWLTPLESTPTPWTSRTSLQLQV